MSLKEKHIEEKTYNKLLPELWDIIIVDYLTYDYKNKGTYEYIAKQLKETYLYIQNLESYMFQFYVGKCRNLLKLEELRQQIFDIQATYKFIEEPLFNMVQIFHFPDNMKLWSTSSDLKRCSLEYLKSINCDCKLEYKKYKHHKLCKCLKPKLIKVCEKLRHIVFVRNNVKNYYISGLNKSARNDHYERNVMCGRIYRIEQIIKKL